MFTWRHIVWLLICAVLVFFSIRYYLKNNKPSLKKVLNIACIIATASEITKVFSVIQFVPSQDGSLIYPYIPMNHLPLHLCSIQILLIFYVRFTENRKLRENVLAFMYPTCLLGALMALAMPSIFTTSIPVEKAFVHPIAYQFFIYHTMLIVLGICIALSGEIEWEKRHFYMTMILLYLISFISIYINSMFAQPTYLNGVLQHIDFWPNFMFTYQNPIGLHLTEIWQWYVYLLIIALLSLLLIWLCYYPLIRKRKAS